MLSPLEIEVDIDHKHAFRFCRKLLKIDKGTLKEQQQKGKVQSTDKLAPSLHRAIDWNSYAVEMYLDTEYGRGFASVF